MDSTAKGIRYPAGADAPLGPAQMQTLAGDVDKRLPTYQSVAPAAPVLHQTWIDPDGALWVWDGAAWQPVGSRGILGQLDNAATVAWGTGITTGVTLDITVPQDRKAIAILSLTGSTSVNPVSGILQVTLVLPAKSGRAIFDVNTPVNVWRVGMCAVIDVLPAGTTHINVTGEAPGSIFGCTPGDLRLVVHDGGPA